MDDPRPIPPSRGDLERRRLESTIDQDLYSLTNNTASTSTSHHGMSRSFSDGDSDSSVEYARGGVMHDSRGPHGTPRAASAGVNFRPDESLFIGASPASTAGHHASAMTLGAGVFRRPKGHEIDDSMNGEFDPERSLGRLVGELGKVRKNERMQSFTRPISPFVQQTHPLSPPRSPSPLPTNPAHSYKSKQPEPFSLTQALLSPPNSNGSDGGPPFSPQRPRSQSRFSSLARELGEELDKARQLESGSLRSSGQSEPRPALAETTRTNKQPVAAPAPVLYKDRVKALAMENVPPRSVSAPSAMRASPAKMTPAKTVRLQQQAQNDSSVDVTGLTGLMATPAKGQSFGGLGKDVNVGGDAGASIPQTLSVLHARLRALEMENSVSRRRVRELELELERCRLEVEDARESGRRQGGQRVKEIEAEKGALEDLIASLRGHLTRLTRELEQNKQLVATLRAESDPKSPRRDPSIRYAPMSEVVKLREDVERLGREVERLSSVVEEGLEERKRGRGERTLRLEKDDLAGLDEDVERVQKDLEARQRKENAMPSRLRQGLHEAGAQRPIVVPPTPGPAAQRGPPARVSSGSEASYTSPSPASRSSSSMRQHRKHPSSPFPSIRGEHLEQMFFNAPDHDESRCRTCCQTLRKDRRKSQRRKVEEEIDEGYVAEEIEQPAPVPTKMQREGPKSTPAEQMQREREVPPQTVLARVNRELEDDFVHYKAIYCELADQYKLMDAASAVAKRNVLAEHLKEVVDTLEQKADQIASLYDLLAFQDKPGQNGNAAPAVHMSVADMIRNVGRDLGKEMLVGQGR